MVCHHFFTFGAFRYVAIPHELSHGISRLRLLKKAACVFTVGDGADKCSSRLCVNLALNDES
jgi:hypothetical protein